MNLLRIATVFAAFAATGNAARIICYYSSWATYRQGPGEYDVENIDPTLCTHLMYNYAQLTFDGELKEYDTYNDIGDEWHEGQFTKLQRLRQAAPGLKIMIVVGGFNHGPGPFQETVVNPQKRQRWVDSTVLFCRMYGFDGLDIDWQYQDDVGGTPEQLAGFNEVLRMFRQRFDQEGLLLSVASSANFNLIEVNYDMKVMSETLDFINVMAFDLHRTWDNYTTHVSPLHPASTEIGDDRNLNVESVVKKYIELGIDPAKINLAFPLYGKGFTLADPNNNGWHAPVTGLSDYAVLGYYEICKNQWPESWNLEQGVPYASKGDQWVGYDNSLSLAGKILCLVTLGVRNYAVWSIDLEDWRGECFGQTYPLLTTINTMANQ